MTCFPGVSGETKVGVNLVITVMRNQGQQYQLNFNFNKDCLKGGVQSD